MSPVLFNLYLADLSRELSTKCPMVQLGKVKINHLLFADDLILVSSGQGQDMNSLIKITSGYCEQWKLRIAPGKTKIMQCGGNQGTWRLPNTTRTGFDILKEDPFAKYLGIDLEPRARNYCKRRVEKVLRIARDYATALRHLSTDSLDRVEVALALWKSCALSSILYASETVCFTKTDLNKLDAIQCGVARKICQVDNSTGGVASLIETGLTPLSILIKVKKLKFYFNTKELGDTRLVKQALNENMSGNWKSKFMSGIEATLSEYEDCDPDELQQTWTSEFFESELERCFKSLCIFPRNYDIGVRSEFLNDSWQSGVLCSFRAGNACLGNRAPTPRGITLKVCILCKELGKEVLVNELHLVLCCPFLESLRQDIGLRKTMDRLSNLYRTKNKVSLVRLFLGEDQADKEELFSRAIMLERLRTKWYNLV